MITGTLMFDVEIEVNNKSVLASLTQKIITSIMKMEDGIIDVQVVDEDIHDSSE